MAGIGKPKANDTVRVYDFTLNKEITGYVIDLLDVQFTYHPENSYCSEEIRFCFYRDQWQVIERSEPEPRSVLQSLLALIC